MDEKSQKTLRICALVLFLFSILYLFSSFRLKMGTLRNPGPGLIPVFIGILLLSCTGVYLFRVFRQRDEGTREETKPGGTRKNYRAIIGILTCTAIYPFILEPLKFVVSTLAVSFIMLLLLKSMKFVFSFILSLAMAVGAFLIFSRLFGVALPSGFLENLLFRIGG